MFQPGILKSYSDQNFRNTEQAITTEYDINDYLPNKNQNNGLMNHINK